MSPHANKVREIRRRVAIAAVAAFLLAFNVIAWTGSMGTTTSSASTSSSQTTTTADEPAAVTTHQS
jgi:hypothetical protein